MIKPAIMATFNLTSVALLLMYRDDRYIELVAIALLSSSVTIGIMGLVSSYRK